MFKIGPIHIKAEDESLFTAEELNFANKGIYLLLGQNGSGKTTFLRELSKILLEKEYISRTEMSYISAMPSYDRSIPLFGKQFFELYEAAPEWPLNFEASFKQLKSKSIREMSSGEFQSVLLISHLFSGKKAYLFDEPFSHLNPAWTKIFVEEINRQSSNALFVIVCHHVEDFTGLKVNRLQIAQQRLELK